MITFTLNELDVLLKTVFIEYKYDEFEICRKDIININEENQLELLWFNKPRKNTKNFKITLNYLHDVLNKNHGINKYLFFERDGLHNSIQLTNSYIYVIKLIHQTKILEFCKLLDNKFITNTKLFNINSDVIRLIVDNMNDI
tara:strand:- start:1183 stop:1608 length:426 start_codon:yes stop_codon:yes gene_type:complete